MSYTPKTFGTVLNRFFEIMRSHWKMLISVGLAPAALIALTMIAFIAAFFWKFSPLTQPGVPTPNPVVFAKLALIIFPIYPIIFFITCLYIAAIATASMRVNRGQVVTAGSAWQQAFSHKGRYCWLLIRQTLVIILPIFAMLTLIVGGSAALIALFSRQHFNSSGFVALLPLIVISYFAGMVYGIWIAVRFSLSFFASIDENLTAAQSMARSWRLTQNAFWRIFGVIFVVYLLIYAAQMVIIILIEIVAAAIVFGCMALGVNAQSPAFPFLVGLGAIVAALLYTAIFSITYAALATALSILYDDQCMRLNPASEFGVAPPVMANEAPTA